MCGEKTATSKNRKLSVGSPPHVRGKAERIWGTPRMSRITPACAGKRLAADFHRLSFGDHPRMCGEKGQAP